MIPIGYCTLPEAVSRVCEAADERGHESNYGLGESRLCFLLTELDLPMYVARESETDPAAHIGEVYRVPNEDMRSLLENAAGDILLSGRAMKVPSMDDPDYEEWAQDFEEDHASESPFDRDELRRCLRRYSDARFIVRADQLEQYLARMWPQPAAFPKTGAPGRPSSMHVVLAEFQRRRANQLTELSREAEAKALAAWLEATHPDAPPCTVNTIKNRLPSDFQPKGNSLPK